MDLATTLSSIGSILAAMAVLSLVEAIVPLCARGRWSRAHLVPNLALTGVALAANLVVNALLLALLVRVESAGIGLLHVVALAAGPAAFVAVAALDLSFYVAHVSWHKVPAFWRFHSGAAARIAFTAAASHRLAAAKSALFKGRAFAKSYPLLAPNRAWRSRFSTLPDAFRGSSGTSSSRSGIFIAASPRPRRNAARSASVGAAPSVTTTAHASSPRSASGRPTTATSRIAGYAER
jgi:hypothetical protein